MQRDNPEMERRCQEVIDRCVALGEHNPIRWFHDVGAGGLSNAIPELLHDSGVGGVIDLDKVPSDDPSLSPMQLWCNESQERYVLGVAQERLAEFAQICARERCPFAAVGTATAEERLVVGYAARRDSGLGVRDSESRGSGFGTRDSEKLQALSATNAKDAKENQESNSQPFAPYACFADKKSSSSSSPESRVPSPELRPIDMPMDLLFGKAPKMHRDSAAYAGIAAVAGGCDTGNR